MKVGLDLQTDQFLNCLDDDKQFPPQTDFFQNYC